MTPPPATATPPVRASAQVPDASGRFGEFGRRFVPETLMPALEELTEQYELAMRDPAFTAELDELFKHYVGRPSPLYFAKRLTAHCGGARIYLKREDLNHTGAHKGGSLPKLALASTELPPPLPAPISVSPA
jgi:tryptophan synthase beta subunit